MLTARLLAPALLAAVALAGCAGRHRRHRLRRAAFRHARASLSVRGGLDYVTVERFDAPDEGYPAFGWGVKAAYSPWFHEHEGFWNLEDTAAVLIDWERRPAPGRHSTDTTLLFGLNYTW